MIKFAALNAAFWMSIGFAIALLLMSGPSPTVNADCPAEPGRPFKNGDVNGDGNLDLSDAVAILSHLFLGGPEPCPVSCEATACGSCCPSSRLPATGQTQCYGYGTSPIDCDDAGYPGQDGYYQAGCPMEGRFVANGDGTVTDRCTGLMWQQETAPAADTWSSALQYCENLHLGGHDDWRLPNVMELHSIVDYGRSNPSIDPLFTALPEWYWSSTSSPAYTPYACRVRFTHGNIGTDPKSMAYYVRAVRTIGPDE